MENIDFSSWSRKTTYEFFAGSAAPFYEINFSLDVTDLYTYVKKEQLSFYYALVYLSTQVISDIDAFLYKIRDGEIIKHDALHPGCTDATPGTEFFHITMLRREGTLAEFCKMAKATSHSQTVFINEERVDSDQLIHFTCIPWIPFTALSNIRPNTPEDSVPRVTFGKFTKQDDRLMMPCSVMVNHRLVDGLHVGYFYENLEKLLASFS